MLNAGKVLVVDNPQPADVILVLAGETDRRPAQALQLLSRGYGRRVLIDVPATAKIYDITQVELAEKYVQHLGYAESVAICPTQGLSTREEAHDAEKCLDREKGSRVLIVTSEFHTRRAFMIFSQRLPQYQWSVTPARNSAQFGAAWWTNREWAKATLDEWMKLIWWNAVERWR